MGGTNRQDLLACSLFRMADHERPAKSKRRSYVCRNCQREFDRASRLKTHEAKCSNKRQRFEVKSHYEVYESIDDMGDNSENEDIMEADSGSDGSDEFDSHEHDWKGEEKCDRAEFQELSNEDLLYTSIPGYRSGKWAPFKNFTEATLVHCFELMTCFSFCGPFGSRAYHKCGYNSSLWYYQSLFRHSI